MREIVFATNNLHKLQEIRARLTQLGPPANTISLLSLEDIGCREELPEPADTLEGNAFAKASYLWDRYGITCFADDTGLEVDALDGRPGVYSARYAGENCSFDDNVNKLLLELKGQNHRSARFRTIICLMAEGVPHYFEGLVEGSITLSPMGDGGFGYDPVFRPDGYEQTFAAMPPGLKNGISHRSRALDKLLEYLASGS